MGNDYSIEAGETLQIEKPEFEHCNAIIKNQSNQQLEIKVKDLSSGEFISGFGLGKLGKESIYISRKGNLFIKNTGKKTAKVKVTFEESKAPEVMRNSVQLTLQNKSAKSIPLIIPSVMNPNLSPFSKSEVNLNIGQKIFFKHKGKKVLLLQVTDVLKDNDTLDVAALIKEKKASL